MPDVWQQALEKLARLDDDIGQVYDIAPFGSHCLGADGTYAQINSLEAHWLGLARADLIGKHRPQDFLSDESRQKYDHYMRMHGNHGFADLELTLLNGAGEERPVVLSFNGYVGDNGSTQKNRSVLFDQSFARKGLEMQRIAAMAFDSLSGICVTDRHGVILQVNASFERLTGYRSSEVLGKTMHLLSSGQHAPDFYSAMWQSLSDNGYWQGELTNRKKNGEVYTEWLSIVAVRGRDDAVTNFVGTFHDISMAKLAQAEVSQLAYIDALTSLPNRRLLLDRLAQTMARCKRSSSYGALIFLDLDHFKEVNDQYGHAAGDAVLQQAALRLRSCVRADDTVSRQGGDEFVVVLNEMDTQAHAQQAHEGAMLVAEKIRAVLDEPFEVPVPHSEGSTPIVLLRCPASLGLTVIDPEDTDTGALLQRADAAMYRAKKLGRNQVVAAE